MHTGPRHASACATEAASRRAHRLAGLLDGGDVAPGPLHLLHPAHTHLLGTCTAHTAVAHASRVVRLALWPCNSLPSPCPHGRTVHVLWQVLNSLSQAMPAMTASREHVHGVLLQLAWASASASQCCHVRSQHQCIMGHAQNHGKEGKRGPREPTRLPDGPQRSWGRGSAGGQRGTGPAA